jgi:hypothetical protein
MLNITLSTNVPHTLLEVKRRVPTDFQIPNKFMLQCMIAHYSLLRCNTTSYGRHTLMLQSTLLPGIIHLP